MTDDDIRKSALAMGLIEHEEMYGPAFLDITNGVAHLVEDCAGYQGAICSAVADEGMMLGFDWCPVCAPLNARPKPNGELHE